MRISGLNKNLIFGSAIIVGTTVGAGIFGIPYVVSKSGLVAGFFYFGILGVAVALLHLFFGEIVLRTKEKHRLIGYAQEYLGNKGKILITISTIVGLLGALLAYIIIGGDFLYTIFSPLWSISSFYWSLFFWGILSFFVFLGIKFIAPLEFLMNIIFIAIILFIFLVAVPKINLQNTALLNLPDIFLPYGVLLFAFAGWLAIPEAASILRTTEELKSLKKIIIWATVTVAFLYLIFTLAVVGVSGQHTAKDALSGLIPFLGNRIVQLGALFGAVAVAASFLVLGNYLKNALRYDYGIPVVLAASLACVTPLILFLLGLREFITIIGLVGIFIGVIEGTVIILIFQKAKLMGSRVPEYSIKVPKFFRYALIFIFIFGALAEAYSLFV